MSFSVFFSAAEVSADAHGADLYQEIKILCEKENIKVNAFGMGGTALKKAGCEIILPTSFLSVMGVGELFLAFPRIVFALMRLVFVVYQRKPSVIIVIDAPDFHFLLLRCLFWKKIPVVYFIPPKVWIWRLKRIFFLKKYVQLLICLFPFEIPFYKKWGIQASYQINPLVKKIKELPTKQYIREKKGVGENDYVIAILPGSRKTEVRSHLLLAVHSAMKAMAAVKEKKKTHCHFFIPVPEFLLTTVRSLLASLEKTKDVTIHLSSGDSHECLVASDVGLIKSGTSSLEAGLLQCPHILFYRPHFLTFFLFKKLVAYQGPVGLMNIVEGFSQGNINFFPSSQWMIPEFIGDQATEKNLSQALGDLIENKSQQMIMKKRGEQALKKLEKKDNKTDNKRDSPAEKIVTLLKKTF